MWFEVQNGLAVWVCQMRWFGNAVTWNIAEIKPEIILKVFDRMSTTLTIKVIKFKHFKKRNKSVYKCLKSEIINKFVLPCLCVTVSFLIRQTSIKIYFFRNTNFAIPASETT